MTAWPAPAELRVAIVEDHQLFAEAMDLALRAEGYTVRRVTAPDDPTAPVTFVRSILKDDPDVVLLDLDLGDFGDGGRIIEQLVSAGADVVVVTGSTDRPRWGGALRAGARAVLSKRQPLDDVIDSVRRLRTGLPVMDPADRDELVAEWARHREELDGVRERLDLLSVREREVLGHLMRGRGVREIAGRSVVSEATVRTQVKAILAKLEVSSQLAAVGIAHEIGWQANVQ